MPYLEHPNLKDLNAMKQDTTNKMKVSWRRVTDLLNAYRDRIKLSNWENYALEKADQMKRQSEHDELEHLLRDFFVSAGSNIGLEKEHYKRRRT